VEPSTTSGVVEIAIFKTKEGVTPEALLATVDPVSRWAQEQPGFISRDLTYAEDSDTWIDVVWWDSLDAARAAADVSMTSEACAPMFDAIELEGTQMLHGTRMIPTVSASDASIGA
jgi:heme-degrading monooxygenase HmoA